MRTTLVLTTLVASATLLFAQKQYQPVDVGMLRQKISVRMGESAAFTFDRRGDHLVNPRAANGRDKKSTVMLKLTKSPAGLSALFIRSPFRKTLRFKGAARFKGRAGFFTINTYPVRSKILDAVGYSRDIEEFVVWDIRLTEEPTL